MALFLPILVKSTNIVNVMSNMWPLLIVEIGQTFVVSLAASAPL